MEDVEDAFFEKNKKPKDNIFNIVYDSLYSEIKFSICTLYPSSELTDFKSYLNKYYKFDDKITLKNIYAGIHSRKKNIQNKEIIKKRLENLNEPEKNNYVKTFLSKITENNYISKNDIIKYLNDVFSKKNVKEDKELLEKKEKIVYGTIAEWLSVILDNEMKNQYNIELKNIINNVEDYIIYVIERDIFNGVFKTKSFLFSNFDFDKYENNNKFKRIKYKFFKFILGNEISNNESQIFTDLFKDIINEENKEILNYQKFIEVKKNYNNFMKWLFNKTGYNYEALSIEIAKRRKIQEQLKEDKEKLKMNIELDYFEYSVLIKNFYEDYNFYNKLLFLLLFLCNNLTYPMITIVNSFIFLSDLIHLNKSNIHLSVLSYFLDIIGNSINSSGFKSKIFKIPILQLKILISLHDIWDFLFKNNIPFYDHRFYHIKDIFNGLRQVLFKGYLTSSKSINYLYYSFIFKKGIRKLKWNKNIVRAMRYFDIVYDNILDEDLKKDAEKCLKYCEFKTNIKIIKKK